jgi:hypothetical protein
MTTREVLPFGRRRSGCDAVSPKGRADIVEWCGPHPLYSGMARKVKAGLGQSAGRNDIVFLTRSAGLLALAIL